MGCLVRFVTTVATSIVHPSLTRTTKKNKNGGLRAKLHDGDDPLLQAAVNGTSLRFQESHRPEPLFIDPYAGCFVSPDIQMDMEYHPHHHYCLATKFIDDKLISTMNNIDGLKQVVLLTDGMDTRPYRLNWPLSTIIYDISPKKVFTMAAQKLKDVGAKIPGSCLFLHVPLESTDLQHDLCRKGFNGNRPSIWAFQGLPLTNLTSFKDILSVVGSLAMKGCLLLGELPLFFEETEAGINSSAASLMDKLFMSNGFRVELVDYDEVSRKISTELGDYKKILFVAEHLRFSDDQMETWRKEFQRMEEEGDEDGFEEL